MSNFHLTMCFNLKGSPKIMSDAIQVVNIVPPKYNSKENLREKILLKKLCAKLSYGNWHLSNGGVILKVSTKDVSLKIVTFS